MCPGGWGSTEVQRKVGHIWKDMLWKTLTVSLR